MTLTVFYFREEVTYVWLSFEWRGVYRAWLWLYACMLSYSVMSNSLTTAWTIASQAPLSMGFSRQEYWIGLPFPPPGDLPDPGIEPRSPGRQILYYLSHQGSPWRQKSEVKVKSFSHVWLLATPWTVACKAPLSMGFSRQEYWSRLLFPSPGEKSSENSTEERKYPPTIP